MIDNNKQVPSNSSSTAKVPSNAGTPHPDNLADAIRAIVDPVGGIELDIPPRSKEPSRPPPDFSGPEYGPDD
jgi:hypothetical protein